MAKKKLSFPHVLAELVQLVQRYTLTIFRVFLIIFNSTEEKNSDLFGGKKSIFQSDMREIVDTTKYKYMSCRSIKDVKIEFGFL